MLLATLPHLAEGRESPKDSFMLFGLFENCYLRVYQTKRKPTNLCKPRCIATQPPQRVIHTPERMQHVAGMYSSRRATCARTHSRPSRSPPATFSPSCTRNDSLHVVTTFLANTLAKILKRALLHTALFRKQAKHSLASKKTQPQPPQRPSCRAHASRLCWVLLV